MVKKSRRPKAQAQAQAQAQEAQAQEVQEAQEDVDPVWSAHVRTMASIAAATRLGNEQDHEAAALDASLEGDAFVRSCILAEANKADLFGDGDQTPLQADHPNQPGQRLRDFWSEGVDMGEMQRSGQLTPITAAAFVADVGELRRLIDATAAGSEERRQLLERRVTPLRLSALLVLIVGARTPGIKGPQHLEAARLLCEAGARVNCKDLAGYTPSYHACTAFATPESLSIFRMMAGGYGADVNLRNRFGALAIMECCMSGRDDVMEAVLAHGADVARSDVVSDGEPNMPIFRMAMAWPAGQKLLSEALEPHRKRVLKAGDLCQVVKLRKQPELNGQVGVLGEEDFETGRWTIALEDGRVFRVRRHNLKARACEGCGAAAENKCPLCKQVYYCGPQCQKKDWRQHKRECEGRAAGGGGGGEGAVLTLANGAGNAAAKTAGMYDARTQSLKRGGDGGTPQGPAGPDGRLTFPVKVQVPVSDNSMGELLVYNRDRSFCAMVCHPGAALDPNPRYGELRQLVERQRNSCGQKAYLGCVYEPQSRVGQIALCDRNVLALQSW